MIIFTPNTVIRSTEINANFDELADIGNWSNPYKFHAKGIAAAQSIGVGSTKVQLEGEAFDTNNNYNTSTYEYTAPISGYYQFNVTLRVDTSATPSFVQINLVVGATTYKLSSTPSAASTQHTTSGAVLAYMTAGQTAYVNAYNSAGTSTIYKDYDSRFSGFFVSAT